MLTAFAICLIPLFGESLCRRGNEGGNWAVYGVASGICAYRNGIYLSLFLGALAFVYDYQILGGVTLLLLLLCCYRLWGMARYVKSWREQTIAVANKNQ
jgi:hypothetical protein